MVAVGIDPGKNTGFAVWDCKGKEFLALDTVDFWQCFGKVAEWQGYCAEADRYLIAYVEDPRGNKPVFDRGQNRKKNLKVAQNVGGNKKEAELIIAGLRRDGIVVISVVPRSHKWDAKTFNNITGHQGRTNEHVRDAARMVFGMGPMADSQYQKLKQELKQPTTG